MPDFVVLDLLRLRLPAGANRIGLSLRVLLVCLAGLLCAACDTRADQQAFEEDASQPPSGFTRTTPLGETLEVDDDDWRTAPALQGLITVDPAFPNPTSSEELTIPVNIRGFGAIQGRLVVRALTADNRFPVLDELPNASSAGVYVFRVSPLAINVKGLQRLFIYDTRGTLVSYGDVLIE